MYQEWRNQIVLAAAGLVQGTLLWAAYEWWRNEPPTAALLAALIAFAIVAGLVFQLAWTGRDIGRLAVVVVGAGLLFASVALWVWWQVPASGAAFEGDDFRTWTLVLAASIALYILLPFIQIFQASGQTSFPYPELFRHSWNNFFIGALAGGFSGLYWALIELWAALFKILGIMIFRDIFHSDAFRLITLSAVFGMGIALGRENDAIINTLRRVTLALFRFLMPLLAVIALLFLAVLPFTGLGPLWKTGMASPLLLNLLVLMILFINAVFQDGETALPYPRAIRAVVEAALLAMPVFAALALYSIGLRIGQYGLMPERFYALLFGLIAVLYGAGYAAAVLRRTGLALLRPVNLAMSLAVAALALLTHTPLLDPLAWSARDQYARLAEGRVDALQFDFAALRFKLGREGYERLGALEALQGHPERQVILAKVALVRGASSYYAVQPGREVYPLKEEHLDVAIPSGTLPEGLLAGLGAELPDYVARGCIRNERACVVFPIEADGDGEAEYVLFPPGDMLTELDSIYLFDREPDRKWRRAGEFRLLPRCKGAAPAPRDPMLRAIHNAEARMVDPSRRNLKIADWEFHLVC